MKCSDSRYLRAFFEEIFMPDRRFVSLALIMYRYAKHTFRWRLIHADNLAAAFEPYHIAPYAIQLSDAFPNADFTKAHAEMQAQARNVFGENARITPACVRSD
mgnify:CR=1 FL=1